MSEEIADYLRHALSAIEGIDQHLHGRRNFHDFTQNVTVRRAVERELEIIGEAINRVLKIEPAIAITNARYIVYTRNRIIHGYDTVDENIIWKIIIVDLPLLRTELETLLTA
jgi:uncharacterized protein with HEPN domain